MPLGLFRRHVRGRADRAAGRGDAFVILAQREPEIENHRITVLAYYYVGALNIAMHYPLAVRGLESAGDLNRQIERGGDG